MAHQNPFCEIAFRALMIVWIVFLLVVGHTALPLAGDTPEVSRITVYQVKARLGLPGTAVVDVRTYRNWWRSSKKIPTAVREDPSKVGQWIEKYSKNQTLIFYCS
jgi:hypothetical protein